MKLAKRLVVGLVALTMGLTGVTYTVKAADEWPTGVDTGSAGAIVMSYDTGTVLYESNAYEALYPASITKVMSALLVIENCKLDEVVTFSEDAVLNNEGEGSNIARDIGEEMTVEECLYAVLLESANECTYALAEHVAGSADKFVDMMNERAQALGCKNTHFVTVNGLHDPDHYTCCYDMALIAREAYTNETFRIITGTKAYDIPPTNKHKEYTYLRNDNSMLAYYSTNAYIYDYCTGGKPGYTPEARFTQVEYAEKDGMTLIAVVMGAASGVQYQDCINMFDYCFDNFMLWNIKDHEDAFAGEEESFFKTSATMFNSGSSLVSLDETAQIILPVNVDFSAAKQSISYDTDKEDVAGVISYTYSNRTVGQANINIIMQEQDISLPSDITATEVDEEIEIDVHKVIFVAIAIVIVIVLLIVLRYFVANYYIIKNRLARRKKRKAKARAKKPRKSNISFSRRRRR